MIIVIYLRICRWFSMRYIGNKTKLLDKLERLLVKKGLTKKV